MSSTAIDLDEVCWHLAERLTDTGQLVTSDLIHVNELARRIRQQQREPKRKSWWNWLVG
jgi:hypothetical protein